MRIMVISDSFSGYSVFAPVHDKTANTVAETLFTKWYSIFGFPNQILSDNDKSFQNEVAGRLHKMLGIQRFYSSYFRRSTNSVRTNYLLCKWLITNRYTENTVTVHTKYYS